LQYNSLAIKQLVFDCIVCKYLMLTESKGVLCIRNAFNFIALTKYSKDLILD